MNARLLLPAVLLLSATAAIAQEPPPSGPGGPPPMQQRGGHERDGKEMRGGPEGEHGMFWKDPKVVTSLSITPDQLKKMDDLWTQSKVKLIDLHATLEKEQLVLDPLMNANPVDLAKASAEIDKIADARAALEKTSSKMFLSIRSVLTADQFTKLQAMHDGHRGHEARGPEGPGGPGGQQGPGTHQHRNQPPPSGSTPPPPAE